jgi:hypothetical protein
MLFEYALEFSSWHMILAFTGPRDAYAVRPRSLAIRGLSWASLRVARSSAYTVALLCFQSVGQPLLGQPLSRRCFDISCSRIIDHQIGAIFAPRVWAPLPSIGIYRCHVCSGVLEEPCRIDCPVARHLINPRGMPESAVGHVGALIGTCRPPERAA